MSEAKHRGRNTWQMFSPALARRVENSLAIENQLRHALGHGELHLLYQPQVELASGRVIAAEALLRWRHPQRGELQPLEFVQHAESTGDIVAIGAWAIDEACRQLREWRDAGVSLDRVAVNVSYRQLLSESFLDTVLTALRRHGLPGDALELELIERMLIDDTPDTLQTFNTLREVGVTITIDDFGEGYSALNYLRQLPIDGFKISYDFMRRVPASHADAAICEAIIRVGHALGLTMIAEGVETEAQRTFLLRHGMMLGQGHLFSPALDPAAFATHIRALR
jgi:EAL domain-containing protein (putative c-di-GMP-specific phosphodiesterase class I)